MKEKILALFKKGMVLTEDQIMSLITEKPIARSWNEEDFKIWDKILNTLIELKKDNKLKSYNNGSNAYSYKLI